ncbi:uncharacterized protein RCC_07569 [Ramularia collo-cygni]|uniref:NAD(P)-binding domain-containing protein n=1 Tax=Ramularia collo-cygni TaxID=112498 RepID=A0A2D3VFN4_9PEZI|nr:uncharacterized protein RCC_07569 [Ramularia collo-cygni]CZT21704.1 uncharacterized protein RCC_07569 [Ramularia collo-cygni]
MTILLTGSHGKTTLPLSTLLSKNNHPHLLCSRHSPPSSSSSSSSSTVHTVHFNWLHPSTYINPFTHPLSLKNPIKEIYITAHETPEISDLVMKFLKIAREKGGVRRVVVVSAWEIESDDRGVLMGRACAFLRRWAEEWGVEWVVLRPHYFMDNFLTYYHPSIRSKHTLPSASGGAQGKKPFIDARDIALVAYHALVDNNEEKKKKMERNREYILTGPCAYSDVEVATLLSKTLSQKVTCPTLPESSFRQYLLDQEISPYMANYLASLEMRISRGEICNSEQVTDCVREITGKDARRLEDFIEEHRGRWL